MSKYLVVAILSVLIFATGCQKTIDYYEFDLTIVDQNGTPVEGAQVEGYIKPVGNNGIGVFELSETKTSDAAGTVNVEIDKESAFSFRFDITRNYYFEASHEILADQVPFTKPYVGELILDSQSWFRLNIQNTSGAVAVFWDHNAEAPECQNCCAEVAGDNVITGTGVDTSFICSLYGDQTFQLQGSYTDPQINEHPINHSLMAPAGDTLVFNLDY